MDWYSWLSRADLEPSLIYQYGVSFSRNELDHKDIAYFDHEFLQSMGISIAKHRLEILKLSRRHRKSSRLSRIIKKTGRCFSDYFRSLIRGEDSYGALVVVPRSTSSGIERWNGAMLKRNKRSLMPSNGNGGFESHESFKQERLLLTNGMPCKLDRYSGPMVCDSDLKEEKILAQGRVVNYCGKGLEEIKWDSMFQNLKPT